MPGWHSTNPFERTGRRDQLPAYENFSGFTGIWTIAKRLANSKRIANIQRGQRVDPKNFRPVSLISTCSKVMERIIKFALVQFADLRQL